MVESTRHTVTGKKPSTSARESDDEAGGLKLVEIGPGKLVLTKVGVDDVPGAQKLDCDDLQIVSSDLRLEGPIEPDHDPYNRHIINKGDIWYRVRRNQDDSETD